MTEPPATQHSPITKVDWLLIGLLVGLVVPLRLWLLYNTEVTARDSIGYIRYALQFEQKPWHQVWNENDQHPGYPMLIWAMSQPVRAIAGETTPENMELSAQLVSLFASLLLIVPMYLTGRQFYDRRISFWGALLFQYLPVSAQHLSDGISEPAYLLFLVCGLLQAVHAVRDRSVWRGALCGMFTGLAYLIRPEGLLILPALGLMLIVVQLVPAWRGSWTRFASCGAAAALSVAVFIGIFFSATGKITTKPSVRLTVGLAAATQVQPEDHVASGNRPLFAASFPRADQKGVQFQRSVWALCMEINHGLLYIAGLPALFGFLWLVNTLRREPGFWVMAVYFGIHAFILVKLAMAVSYISDRHVMSLVMTACFYVAVGFHELPRLFLAWRQSRSNLADAQSSFVPWHQKASVWCTILMVALIGACVPKAAQRLHGNRAGNHAAGIWLADHVKVGDVVEDDHAWSHFFSGLILAESRDPILPADAQPTCYVVATRSRDASIGFRNEKVKLREDAAVVYRWPENVELVKARVVVYAQPREMEFHPWRVARQ